MNQDKNAIAGDNNKTKGVPQFEYGDIKYLIVKDDNERVCLIDFIDNKLKTQINNNDKTILKSKILTAKQIEEDF